MTRRFGLLLHPTSLPGRFGRGDLGPEADRFLEWMHEAGAGVWQVLPLGPCGYGDSPYGGASAFAGNRYLISPERLVADGWLDAGDLETAPPPMRPDDSATFRENLLDRAWRRFRANPPTDRLAAFDAFRRDAARARWLPDWALFTSIKADRRGARWTEWPAPLARREPAALAEAARRLADETAKEEFVQFLFFTQWDAVRRRAFELSIAIFGDMPIYVAHDSADVWAHPELFDLDDRGEPVAVSGVPPDYFSATGQRWGSPIYRWDRCREQKWAWWIDRFRSNLALADLVRIDHFRGFAGFWAIPASESTAIAGEWRRGPGRELFDAVREAVGGGLPFVAEDLGVITSDVVDLRDRLGLPGMRVLQFGFDGDDSPHLPHRHVPNCFVYTGTHDNDTARGWLDRAPAAERGRALDYTGSDGSDFPWSLLRTALESVAETAIAPLADVLGLGSEARLNTPGNPEGNWKWQAPPGAFSHALAARLRRLCALTGRAR